MAFRLVVISGPTAGDTFDLEEDGVLLIGRGMASDTKINDAGMSRIHCKIISANGVAKAVDAGSSSGTFVGGARVDEAELVPENEIVAGNTHFRFENMDVTVAANEPTIPHREQQPPIKSPKETHSTLKDLVGSMIQHYRIEEIVAKGNNGMVYRATDTKNNQPVALKVMPPTFASDEEQKARFIRAMKTMMPIKHNHIVEIYNAGKTGPFCWIAMEYISGTTLTEIIDLIGIDGMLDWQEVWRIGVQIGRALNEASKHNIIHRNLTPTNIMRRSKDRACVLGDLMLAKALDGKNAVQITQPGQLIGDLPYMAPERTKGAKNADTRSDIYGLGATMYALLTGHPPCSGNSMMDLLKSVREEVPKKPKEIQLGVDDLFQDVVMQMLEKDPNDRQPTTSHLLKDLQRIGKFNNLEADWSGWSG